MTLDRIILECYGNSAKTKEIKAEIKDYILSLLPKEAIGYRGEEDWVKGYNQCLDDIKERIEKEME
jgi:hypothetical protein